MWQMFLRLMRRLFGIPQPEAAAIPYDPHVYERVMRHPHVEDWSPTPKKSAKRYDPYPPRKSTTWRDTSMTKEDKSRETRARARKRKAKRGF